MCGIVGYVGDRNCVPILINGLKRLEYRGYDSAGIGILNDGISNVVKNKGKVSQLEKKIEKLHLNANIGIGHTRWATHGVPNEINAHPHTNESNSIFIIHNGIIENFRTLKTGLEKLGYKFISDTDSEVFAHLIDSFIKKGYPLFKSVQLALGEIEGTYGLAVIYKEEPDKIIAARKGSPLLVGIGAFIMYGAGAMSPVYMGCFIVGFGAGINLPLVQSRGLAIGVKADGTFANSMVIGVMNGGQFLATFVEKGVGVFVEPTARNLIGSVSIAMIVISVVCLIYVLVDPLKGVNASPDAEAIAASS